MLRDYLDIPKVSNQCVKSRDIYQQLILSFDKISNNVISEIEVRYLFFRCLSETSVRC